MGNNQLSSSRRWLLSDGWRRRKAKVPNPKETPLGKGFNLRFHSMDGRCGHRPDPALHTRTDTPSPAASLPHHPYPCGTEGY